MIEKAAITDIPEILCLYEAARSFMRSSGNPLQWPSSYPGEEIINKDISSGNFYKISNSGRIVAVFSLIFGEDPTYKVIRGRWGFEKPYAVIHRLASLGKVGAARACFDFALTKTDYLRIDTHKDNLPMQKALSDYGFTRRGIIHIADGSERIAYDILRPLSSQDILF